MNKTPPSSKSGQGTNTGKRGKVNCAEFTFDANSKPVVEAVLQLEAKIFKKPFIKKPTHGVRGVAASLSAHKEVSEIKKEISETVTYYKSHLQKKDICNALGRLLLQGASEETENYVRQFQLLYLAIDLFSMSSQYSEKGLNMNSQSLLYSVFKILGSDAWEGYSATKNIREIIKKMYAKTKSFNDPQSREKIFQNLLQGKRYYEAFSELNEYDKIIKVNSKSLWLKKRGLLTYNRVLVLQKILDFYFNYIWGHAKEKEILVDGGKLRAFIMRFNIDHSSKLTPIKDLTVLSLMKTMESIIVVSNHLCKETIKDDHFGAKHNAYFIMALNNFRLEHYKASWANILSSIEHLGNSKLTGESKKKETLKIKNFQLQLAEKMNLNSNVKTIKEEIQKIVQQKEGDTETKKGEEKPEAVEEVESKES